MKLSLASKLPRSLMRASVMAYKAQRKRTRPNDRLTQKIIPVGTPSLVTCYHGVAKFCRDEQ